MKVEETNIKDIPISENERKLLKQLLLDLEEVNSKIPEKIYINWQEFHNEWSPERTDPCPDYYGYYTLRLEKDPYGEIIGVEMTLDDLDSSLCLLVEFVNLEII